MKKYFVLFFSFIFGFTILMVALLIYKTQDLEDPEHIQERLNCVNKDSLNRILIAPSNPKWNINLTIDTIKISDGKEMSKITTILNNLHKPCNGNGRRNTWEAILILDYKSAPDIMLKVVESFDGTCVFYSRSVPNPNFSGNGLKPIFEQLANYKQPLKREWQNGNKGKTIGFWRFCGV